MSSRPPQDPGWIQARTENLAGGKPVDWSPKWLRECLCAQQTNAPDSLTRDELSRLIRLLDLHRPMDGGGKHGKLHTPTCGCER